MTPTDPADPGADPAPQRAPDGKFLKGNTGNRNGRPPGPQGQPGLSPPLRRRVSTDVSGKKRRLNIVDAVVRQLGDRALAGDLAATREFLRLAQAEKAAAVRAAEAEAEARAWEEDNAPLPPPVFMESSPSAMVELALRHLGAATEGEPRTGYDGVSRPGDPILERWVVDAALDRDPTLKARLEEYQWRDIRAVSGEPQAGGAPHIPPWPHPVRWPPEG